MRKEFIEYVKNGAALSRFMLTDGGWPEYTEMIGGILTDILGDMRVHIASAMKMLLILWSVELGGTEF